MGDDCPIGSGNLSFSDDDYEHEIFISQSTFSNVTTQEATEAAEYFDLFGDMLSPATSGVEQNDLLNIGNEISQEDMCSKVFDFLNDHDNGWSVSSQKNPFIVTRNSDGKQFVIGHGVDECSIKRSEQVKNSDDHEFR